MNQPMGYWQKIVRPLAWVVLVLVVARIGLRAAIDSVTKPAGTSGDAPAAHFDSLAHEVPVSHLGGRPSDSQIVERFRVTNLGERRLIVRQMRRACCEPQVEPLILQAGESGMVTVEASTAELLRKGEFRQGLATNDPRHPEVWLTLTLANRPTPAHQPALANQPRPANQPTPAGRAEPVSAAAPATRSVLVKQQ